MPALINNRLAAALEALPAGVTCEAVALAAHTVIVGAADALGSPQTGVAYFKRGHHPGNPDAYVVEWLDGPTDWATAAQHQNEPHSTLLCASYNGLALEFFPMPS